MLYLCYLCRFKPLRDHLRGFLIAAWAGDKIAEFSFPEISFHFPLRPWFFFVSPAYAGKRRTIPRRRSAAPDHPRVCGEKLYPICSSIDLWGSPPRMRGKDTTEAISRALSGITPAYAGKSVLFATRIAPKKDHPRVCGEKCGLYLADFLQEGSPPRMRGKVDDVRRGQTHPGITPAYAGKSVAHTCPLQAFWDHPRVCGEKVEYGTLVFCSKGSPPRMRGKVICVCGIWLKWRITPAYAGKSESFPSNTRG